MRILVPLDGSELSEYALGPAAMLAKSSPNPARIALIRMIKLTNPHLNGTDAPTTVTNMILEACGDYLRQIALRPTLGGTSVEEHVALASGSIADGIIAAAAEAHTDFIVMASKGRSGATLDSLGSVTAAVARTSPIPMIVVNVENDTFHRRLHDDDYRILIPLDGTSQSASVVEPAMAIARALHGRIRLLGVDHSAAELVDTMREQIQRHGIPAEGTLALGDAVAEITRAVRDLHHPVDLVAIASHGPESTERNALGPVCKAIFHDVRLPLLVVRPQ